MIGLEGAPLNERHCGEVVRLFALRGQAQRARAQQLAGEPAALRRRHPVGPRSAPRQSLHLQFHGTGL